MGGRKSKTVSVGEAARRLGVSTDTIRNYCDQGLLQYVRTKGKQRRILLSSIEALEARRKPQHMTQDTEKSPLKLPEVKEEFELYYLGNESYPNALEPGFICNVSQIPCLGRWEGPSYILPFIGQVFGGGIYKMVRVRDGNVVSERTIELPGPTKEDQIGMPRDIFLGPKDLDFYVF